MSLLIVGLVLVTYLGLATHAVVHNPTAGEADCVFCGFGDQPEVTHALVIARGVAVADAAASDFRSAPIRLFRGHLIAVRGPPLTS